MREVLFEGRYFYKGALKQSSCELTVIKKDDRFVVVASETNDNTGASITNSAEELASSVVKEFGIDIDKTMWIEHYPHSNVFNEETFDEVKFEWKGNVASNPTWMRLPELLVEELIGKHDEQM